MVLRSALKSLYRQIPGIRELCAVRELIIRQNRETAILRPIDCIAAEDALRHHPRYGDPMRLHVAGYRTFSQNEEDGMIAEVFRRIGVRNRSFVEIGVGDGAENNTRLLLLGGWTGWWFEGSASSAAEIRNRFARELADSKLAFREGMLDKLNVAQRLLEAGVPNEPDMLSIDVDQLTFHLWDALKEIRPRLVVAEYNSVFRPPVEWVAPETAPPWDGSRDFGASLSSFERLARSRGYALVGCDITGTNAFFVRGDLAEGKFLQPFDAATHYEPPRYGAGGHEARAWDASLRPRLEFLR